MSLTDIESVAEIIEIPTGGGSLSFVAYELVIIIRRATPTQFWLDLRRLFTEHNDVHWKLRSG